MHPGSSNCTMRVKEDQQNMEDNFDLIQIKSFSLQGLFFSCCIRLNILNYDTIYEWIFNLLPMLCQASSILSNIQKNKTNSFDSIRRLYALFGTVLGVFGRTPPEGLLRRSQSRFEGATNCGSTKTAPAPLFFTRKQLLQ